MACKIQLLKNILKLSVSPVVQNIAGSATQRSLSVTSRCVSRRGFHSSSLRQGLMEFFDNPKVYGEDQVKHGRAWKIDELRIKSNQDLHKLWFVLYKEKNMLLTMQEECRREAALFPSPERIDKVEESMENLNAVVEERNHAYRELEEGEQANVDGQWQHTPFGRLGYRRFKEYPIPPWANVTHRAINQLPRHVPVTWKYGVLHREQVIRKNAQAKRRLLNQKKRLKSAFPNAEMD
ncbi:PREDICTED: 39S ribosomal protein L47, mitochondrial-like [Priapulus caudatus]|uniref:Large ribosomal subunit protein uL29m n=1 Tax=Priapulus caudatus TaxID=37621 RepID=A0ABM1EEL9_PRICU|nr:PREDICTED: 39S ribosomal protein L47, mitochondrial-like [Priapulus caudatus]